MMKLPLENITVGQLLRRTAETYPERPALEYCGQVWTYAELDHIVDETARRLLALGIRKGEHIGMWCDSEPNALFYIYASVRIGAVSCLINTGLSRPELVGVLKRSEITKLFIGDGVKDMSYPEICKGLVEEVPTLERIYYIGKQEALAEYPEYPALSSFAPLSEEALKEAESLVKTEDTCFILYTSGTTSVPKAVMGSHYSRANCGIQQAQDQSATKEDKFCVSMPLFHCFCLSVCVLAACSVGACLYLPESRRTTALLEAIHTGKCTVMSNVPTLFHAIISRPDLDQWDLSSLRTGFVGGGMVSPELFKEIDRKLDFTLLSSLGLTEATAGCTTAYPYDSLEVRANTLGHFMNYLEGKITDIHTGADLPIGETGEICVRGYTVMQGYYGMPEETAKAIDPDGWLHTGDMGFIDEDANLHITGRLKELIIRGGENISPAEIEYAVSTFEPVSDCKAIGVPDRHYGEEACLCVMAREGYPFDEQQIRDELTKKLAAYKVPKYIIQVDELPRTASGKVRLKELNELAREKVRALTKKKR